MSLRRVQNVTRITSRLPPPPCSSSSSSSNNNTKHPDGDIRSFSSSTVHPAKAARPDRPKPNNASAADSPSPLTQHPYKRLNPFMASSLIRMDVDPPAVMLQQWLTLPKNLNNPKPPSEEDADTGKGKGKGRGKGAGAGKGVAKGQGGGLVHARWLPGRHAVKNQDAGILTPLVLARSVARLEHYKERKRTAPLWIAFFMRGKSAAVVRSHAKIRLRHLLRQAMQRRGVHKYGWDQEGYDAYYKEKHRTLGRGEAWTKERPAEDGQVLHDDGRDAVPPLQPPIPKRLEGTLWITVMDPAKTCRVELGVLAALMDKVVELMLQRKAPAYFATEARKRRERLELQEERDREAAQGRNRNTSTAFPGEDDEWLSLEAGVAVMGEAAAEDEGLGDFEADEPESVAGRTGDKSKGKEKGGSGKRSKHLKKGGGDQGKQATES